MQPPDPSKLSGQKTAQPALKAATSTARDVSSHGRLNLATSAPQPKKQWKSLEERTTTSFKEFVEGKPHFAIHGNETFLKKHIEAANQSKLGQLGKGSFKKVFKFNGKANKLVAATLNLAQIRENQPGLMTSFASHEVKMAKIMYGLNMPGVVKGGVLENTTTGDYHIFTKKCSEGDAKNFWYRATPAQKTQLLLDFAKGIQSLHKEGYVHRDIKGSNMFIDKGKDGNLRGLVGDLGCATSINNPRLEHTYNPVLMDSHVVKAGEEARTNLIKNSGDRTPSAEELREASEKAMHAATHDPKMDTFAFGLMICCLELGYDQDQDQNFRKLTIAMKKSPNGQQEVINLINQAFPTDSPLKQLVQGMMALDRNDRPSDDEICQRLSQIDPNTFI